MKKFVPKEESKICKVIVIIWKIFIGAVLLVVTNGLFVVETSGERLFGVILLIFVTLPTFFVVFLKNRLLREFPGFAKPWKILRIVYAVIMILFAVFVGLCILRSNSLNKTARAVEYIKSQKITMKDVMGKNLPPEPNKIINDSTIIGIDANNNNIRDDVELEIFRKYPNSAKIRAAELQYAQALQLELTRVFNSETLVAVIQKEDLAFNCLGFSGPDIRLVAAKEREGEIVNTVINTDLRKNQHSVVFKKYMTSYASLSEKECNIGPSLLPN